MSGQTALSFWKETGEKPTSHDSLVRTRKALTVGEKQEIGSIKGKATCFTLLVKDTSKKTEKQAKGKISIGHIQQEPALTIYKELLKLNNKNTNNPVKSGPNTKTLR